MRAGIASARARGTAGRGGNDGSSPGPFPHTLFKYRNRPLLLVCGMLVVHLCSLAAYYGLNLSATDVPTSVAAEQQAFGIGGPLSARSGDYSGGGESTAWAQRLQPRLIPRIIHQTYRSAWKRRMPDDIRRLMATWANLNPGYEIRLYDDAACAAFVAAEFPQYAAAYAALPKNVERSDFFRYMVVLAHGGAYADVDTECRQPLDALVRPGDTLVAGWENEFESPEHTRRRSYIRQRQLLQWAFLAAPGHPVLRALCEHVAAHARRRFSAETNRDTLEKTGPGAFTDAVLRHFAASSSSAGGGGESLALHAWPVRILPRVAFATNPGGHDGIPADAPGIRLLHHFRGSWKDEYGRIVPAALRLDKMIRWRTLGRHLLALFPALTSTPAALQWIWDHLPPPPFPAKKLSKAVEPRALPCVPYRLKAAAEARRAARCRGGPWCPGAVDDVAGVGLGEFPVSVDLEPPFDMLVEPAGVDRVSREWPSADSSAEITSWGMSYPGHLPWRRPAVPQLILAALGGINGSDAKHRGVWDVGSGLGLFALAAAAHGYPVMALEPSPRRASLLARSAALSGITVGVRIAAAGASPGSACWQDAALARSRDHPEPAGPTPPACSDADVVPVITLDDLWGEAEGESAEEHAASPVEGPSPNDSLDDTSTSPSLLPTRASPAIPPPPVVLRLAVGGAAEAVVAGARRLLKHRPPAVILLDLQPRLMTSNTTAGAAAMVASRLLGVLRAAGYPLLLHAGAACDAIADTVTQRCAGRHCGGLQPSAGAGPAHLAAAVGTASAGGVGGAPRAGRGDRMRSQYMAKLDAAAADWLRLKTACKGDGAGGASGGDTAWGDHRRRRLLALASAEWPPVLDSMAQGNTSRVPAGGRRLHRVFGVDDGDEVPNASSAAAKQLRAPWDSSWCRPGARSLPRLAASCHRWLPETVLLLRRDGTGVDANWLARMLDHAIEY